MIKGVFFKKIKSHKDKRGFFREVIKDDCKLTKKKIRQISHSLIKKNVVKAWHVHTRQSQWNYLIKGKITVFLYDLRPKSKTYKKKLKFSIKSNKNKILYFFPPNVAHGYVTKESENHMLYGTSGTYDPKEEYKINTKGKLIPNFFNEK